MDKAKLVVENNALRVWEFTMTEQEFSKTNKSPFECVKYSEIPIELNGENPQHKGVIESWGGAILRGEPLVAVGTEGINGLTLSNAMHLSSFKDKRVEIPFDEEDYLQELQHRMANSRKKEGVVEITAKMDQSWRR